MGGELKVNFAQLEQVALDIKQGAGRIDSRLTRLENELAFLRSDWTGEARESYGAAKKKWDGATERMNVILTDLSQAVQEAKVRYEETEKKNTGRFAG